IAVGFERPDATCASEKLAGRVAAIALVWHTTTSTAAHIALRQTLIIASPMRPAMSKPHTRGSILRKWRLLPSVRKFASQPSDAIASSEEGKRSRAGRLQPMPIGYCDEYASTSVIRVQMSLVRVTKMRILVVVTGANVRRHHTNVFPLTIPPGTVSH